jgi:hypothetical protein
MEAHKKCKKVLAWTLDQTNIPKKLKISKHLLTSLVIRIRMQERSKNLFEFRFNFINLVQILTIISTSLQLLTMTKLCSSLLWFHNNIWNLVLKKFFTAV